MNDDTSIAYDPAEEDALAAARDKAALEYAEKLEMIRQVMALAQGRRWIYGVLERCHIYHTPFVQGQADATAFRCGEENIGLMLLADVQDAAPAEYLVMIGEAKVKENADAANADSR